MIERETLPARRHCETFELEFGGLHKPHTVSVGFYQDGRPAEVFITGGKSGELVDALARDFAVLVSLALQHNVPLKTISHALTRDTQNQPMSIAGAVVDRLTKAERQDGQAELFRTQGP
jgi:hypothetical protein